MSHRAKKEYLEAIRQRYREATKYRKHWILNEFCLVCNYSRKYAIRILNGDVEPREKKPGPKVTYGQEVANHIRALWVAMDQPSSARMHEALKHWLQHYKVDALTPELRLQLGNVSPATINRILKPIRKAKGLSTTSPNYFFRKNIPLQLLDWNVKEPGYIEADTVAHCGDSIMGSYVHTITATDILTNWTENRAIWTKGTAGLLVQMKDIEESFPFPIKGFKTDNGSEFHNYQMFYYFQGREQKIKLSRSRPYRKNDNALVEQKNFTHVRKLFGYARIDREELVGAMNHIYKNLWNPLQNFFMPTQKLIRKERIGARVKKTHDAPKTPYHRLLESPEISEEAKTKLRARYEVLDPFKLKEELDRCKKAFFDELRRNQIRRVI